MTAILDKGADKKVIRIKDFWRKVFVLTMAGGLGFWLANFAISRTPIAAEYRAALSISYYPMLLEALLGGLVIAFCTSFLLLRFFDKLPTQIPMLKSVILSLIVLFVVTILIGNPAYFQASGDAWRYFLIGTSINVIRVLALGIGIGYGYEKLYGEAR
jgi:hypothetical protein